MGSPNNRCRAARASHTSTRITGTSMRGPTTVASGTIGLNAVITNGDGNLKVRPQLLVGTNRHA